MQQYHRWFLLPVEQYTVGRVGDKIVKVSQPKLVGQDDRLDGFVSGGPLTQQEVEHVGYSGLLRYSDANEWRVVVAWGEGNEARNALNELHANHHDTATLTDHGQDVTPVMNTKFGGNNWSLDIPTLPHSENTA